MKGKSKLVYNEDDIPLAQLKKARHEQQIYLEPLSNLEIATLSFIELQDAAPPKGPVHNFLTSPLHRPHGQILDAMPQPVMPFAPDVFVASLLADSTSIKISEGDHLHYNLCGCIFGSSFTSICQGFSGKALAF